jgi:tetratricopeptide (TPR) repeat protein
MFVLVVSVPNMYAAENNYELLIARGMEKISERQYSEALELLEKALEMAPDDTEAIYYTALAYTRLGELDKAEELFLRIKDVSSVLNANFELGRIYYVKEECEKSGEYLSRFVSQADDDALISYADSLIRDCRETEKAVGEEKPYRLNVTAGIQYDDNVIVEQGNPIVPEDKRKEDGMVIIYVDAGADLFNSENIKLKTDYNFYQSLHFDLNDYNVHYHKITPAIEGTYSDIIKPSIGYSYEHTLFGGDRYSRVHALLANIYVKEAENFSANLSYEYRDLDYDDTDLFPDNSIRTGEQNVIGVTQNFRFDKVNGKVYYFYNDTDADAEYWAYDGYRLGAEIMYQLLTPLYVTVSGQYGEERYNEDFPGLSERRKDKTQHYSLVLTYRVSDRLIIYLTEDYTSNDSNLDIFEYDRNVIGLLLTVALL